MKITLESLEDRIQKMALSWSLVELEIGEKILTW